MVPFRLKTTDKKGCFRDFIRRQIPKTKNDRTSRPAVYILAEKEGFEPSKPFWGLHDFQSCALDQARRLLHNPCYKDQNAQ